MSAQPRTSKTKGGLIITLLLSAGFLTACGGERSDASSGTTVDITINTPAQIVNQSADDYNDNQNGLITHATLKKWLDNWEENRPQGIKGKLVILQQAQGPAGAGFIKPDNKNVFTYVENSWREPRSNGVITIGAPGPGGIVLSGTGIDNLVKRYGIDLQNDLIVCAQGGAKNGAGNYMNQGRCWYTLSYWGVAQKNLAVLNGNNAYLAEEVQLGAAYFTDTVIQPTAHPSPLVNRQVSTVKDLKVDNTALYASVEDLINVLPLTDEPVNGDGVLLWDGRSLREYSAGLQAWGTNGQVTNTPLADRTASVRNAGSRQSHPRGALHLEYSNVLDVVNGVYYSKDTLRNILNGELSPTQQGFVSGGVNADYQYVQAGNAYQPGDTIYHFCETSARSGTTLIAAAVILGIPSRLYDSGLVEWNSLTGKTGTAGVDKNGLEILPANSPWNTAGLSAPWFPNTTASINPRNAYADPDSLTTGQVLATGPKITDPYAADAQAIPRADRAYKKPVIDTPVGSGNNNGGTGNGGSSGGSVLPPNPCGG